jgi:hypothetical protein
VKVGIAAGWTSVVLLVPLFCSGRVGAQVRQATLRTTSSARVLTMISWSTPKIFLTAN